MKRELEFEGCGLISGDDVRFLQRFYGDQIVEFEQRKEYDEYTIKVHNGAIEFNEFIIDSLSEYFELDINSETLTIKYD